MQERPRYELCNAHPGFVVIERELHSGRVRSYFSGEPVAPKESYLEGEQEWRYVDSAQSARFRVRDNTTGKLTSFDEMLGLLYYACVDQDTPLYKVGSVAHDVGISIYVALAYPAADGSPQPMPLDKIAILNRVFNDRLRAPGKRVLIVPDLFGIEASLSHGQMLLDFGLTDMEGGAAAGAP
jgi:hypothetical protein